MFGNRAVCEVKDLLNRTDILQLRNDMFIIHAEHRVRSNSSPNGSCLTSVTSTTTIKAHKMLQLIMVGAVLLSVQ